MDSPRVPGGAPWLFFFFFAEAEGMGSMHLGWGGFFVTFGKWWKGSGSLVFVGELFRLGGSWGEAYGKRKIVVLYSCGGKGLVGKQVLINLHFVLAV